MPKLGDGNKLLTDVPCKYGAPKGRARITTNQSAKVQLFRVRFVSGDYDRGGAYWGGGGCPLYAAIGDGFQDFVRAFSRWDAKAKMQFQYPNLRFYR
jgi:hypothetical protein